MKRISLIPLIALIGLALVFGMWAGLIRMGWVLPIPQPQIVGHHGALMISGVLGTLICLERAVALSALCRTGVVYLAPLLTTLGTLLLIIGFQGHLFIVLGSFGLVLILAWMIRQQTAPYTLIMGIGAGSWFVGNLLWFAGRPIYEAVHWWTAFLILTIVGERLELSRVTRLTAVSERLLLVAAILYSFCLLLTLVNLDVGVRVAGLGQLTLAMWLLRYDIARHTIHRSGLPRYIAACLMSGYVWLGISGVMSMIVGAVYAGFLYDALLHTILLGFVFSMIFGHAPIIFPALTKRNISYQSFFYGHLLLLHLSLALRVFSDVMMWQVGRQWGGLLNVTVIVLFAGGMLFGMVRGAKKDTQFENRNIVSR